MKVRARGAKEAWREDFEAAPTRDDGIETSTISGIPLQPLYTSEDLPQRAEEHPGQFPYTRGIHPSGYRGRLWTMRQFSGFATAEETNRRYKYLLANGQTGLSVAFDMPTLMGQDSDAPTSRGEVGHCGVAIDSLADMETLFEGIPLGEITTSMTINSPAAILLCMYIAVAEKQGVPASSLGGTLQNDILKEFIAQKEFIFPPAPSMRLVVDSIEYCAAEVPKWNTISISGYHIREAGSTAAQELAFTLADGIAYVDAALRRGLDVDDFAGRLSFFFAAWSELFEEGLHVRQRADGNSHPAHLAPRPRRVRVVAHLGRQVEGDRKAGLTLRKQVLESLVGLGRGREAGVLAHRPEPAAVHRGLDAPGERVLPGAAEVARLVEPGGVG